MKTSPQIKVFSVARYGKRRLADLIRRYEAAGWRVSLDEQTLVMTATLQSNAERRRHARGTTTLPA